MNVFQWTIKELQRDVKFNLLSDFESKIKDYKTMLSEKYNWKTKENEWKKVTFSEILQQLDEPITQTNQKAIGKALDSLSIERKRTQVGKFVMIPPMLP